MVEYAVGRKQDIERSTKEITMEKERINIVE